MEQKEINRLHLMRLGKILNNFTILGLAYMLLTALTPVLSFLSFIVVGLIFVVMLLPWILSAFTINIGKITEWFNAESAGKIINILYTYLPYVFGVAAACAVASAVILILDKKEKHIGRIIVAALAIVVGVVALIMKAKGVTV